MTSCCLVVLFSLVCSGDSDDDLSLYVLRRHRRQIYSTSYLFFPIFLPNRNRGGGGRGSVPFFPSLAEASG